MVILVVLQHVWVACQTATAKNKPPLLPCLQGEHRNEAKGYMCVLTMTSPFPDDHRLAKCCTFFSLATVSYHSLCLCVHSPPAALPLLKEQWEPEGRGPQPEICVWDNQNKSHIVWSSTLAAVNNQIYNKKRQLGPLFQIQFIVCEKKTSHSRQKSSNSDTGGGTHKQTRAQHCK